MSDDAIAVLADLLAAKDEQDPDLKFLDLDFDDMARGLLYALHGAGYRVVKQERVGVALLPEGSSVWSVWPLDEVGHQGLNPVGVPVWRDAE